MGSTNVQQMENWFAENGRKLSTLFPILRFQLWHPADQVRGKGGISVDGPSVTASITLWNKGDVEVLVLDHTSGARDPVPLDDRHLTPDEKVSSLLETYIQRIKSLLREAEIRKEPEC